MSAFWFVTIGVVADELLDPDEVEVASTSSSLSVVIGKASVVSNFRVVAVAGATAVSGLLGPDDAEELAPIASASVVVECGNVSAVFDVCFVVTVDSGLLDSDFCRGDNAWSLLFCWP